MITLVISYTLALIVLVYLPNSFIPVANIFCACLSTVLVWLLSPVEDNNKPLSERERSYFKRKSRVSVSICATGILIGTLLNKFDTEILAFSLGMSSVSISLVAAYLKNLHDTGANAAESR